MSEYDESYHCFRCKGMSVIHKQSIEHLVQVLGETVNLLGRISSDANVVASAQVEAEALAEKLNIYAIMIESLPDD